MSGFRKVIDTLVKETINFGAPVYLVNGDGLPGQRRQRRLLQGPATQGRFTPAVGLRLGHLRR